MSEQENVISVEKLQKIELPQFDPKPFIGKKAIVDEITVHSKQMPNGKVSTYVQFKALVDPTGFNGEPLYATRNVGVQVDDKGVIGWGDNTNMAKFLEANKVEHPKDMKGKSIIVQTQKDSTYLTF